MPYRLLYAYEIGIMQWLFPSREGYFSYMGHCPIYHDDEQYCSFIKCPSNTHRMAYPGGCHPRQPYNNSCYISADDEKRYQRDPCKARELRCCNTRCVHRDSICDGVKDCPDGADELNCGTPICREDQFHCASINCFPLELQCDGFPQCPDKTDEKDCELKQISSQPKTKTTTMNSTTFNDRETCTGFDTSMCVNASTICEQTGRCFLRNNDTTCFLGCPLGCNCDFNGYINCDSWNLEYGNSSQDVQFKFDTSNISSAEYFYTFQTMSYLSIINASLVRVPSLILSCAFNIHALNLSYNLITSLQKGDFGRLYRLSALDLSHNLIQSIEDFSFKGMRVFELNLDNNLISSFGVDIFSGMAVDGTLDTDEYRLCCVRPDHLPEHKCSSKADTFSSCKNLMRDDVLRAFLWVVGFVALIGNSFVLLSKLLGKKEDLKSNFGIMITNLALADVIMGVYLLSIASVDAMYRDHYITKDAEWRNSAWCSLLGVLCMVSSEASVLFICLITVDRYLIVKYPFRQVRMGRCTVITIAICIWISALMLSVMPLLIPSYFKGAFFSTAGVCIALSLSTSSLHGWEYSFAISVGFNCILFLFVGVGQGVIYRTIILSHMRSLVSTRRNNEFKVARQLMSVVISDFLCWIPIGVLGILALAGVPIPSDVYAWFTVFVLPINSALNPFLYTVRAEFFKCKLCKDATSTLT